MTETVKKGTGKDQIRFAPPKRVVSDFVRPDVKELLDNWKTKGDLVKKIKSAEKLAVFYHTITPDDAMDLLKMNDTGKNRHIKWKKLENYVRAKKNKKWKEKNGDTIRISKTFKLLDGQHKLWAIVISGIPCDYIIATGLDDDVASFIDIGANRSAADITSINGYQNHDNALAYAIKCIILFERKSIFKGGVSIDEVPNYEVNEWQQDQARMERMVRDLEMIKSTWIPWKKDFFTAPQWLAILYILRTIPGQQKNAIDFLAQFAEGSNLTRNSPIKIARSYFENNLEQFTKYKSRKRTSFPILTIKVKVLFAAWDLWLDGATVSKIDIDEVNVEIKKPSWKKRTY